MNFIGNQDLPLISIITIVYNDVENIEKTIKSILEQSYKNIQYIVVDGASSDGTKTILEKYKDNIDVFISENDTGISDAFNKGTKLVKGDYINYMNSGDSFIDNNSLLKFVHAIVDSNSDVVTAFSRFSNSRIPKKVVSNTSFINKKSMISHQASFISKKLFDQYGLYDETFKVRMDYEFWLRVLPHSTLFFINETLVDYADGGISGKNTKLNFDEEVRAQRKNLNFIKREFYFVDSTLRYILKKVLSFLKKLHKK
ncbi:MAG: glycosyltransferase family 2 protein [Marinomonas colpomeniae]